MSIILEQKHCLNCGAGLPNFGGSFLTCEHCQSEFYVQPPKGYIVPAPRAYPHPSGVGTVTLGDATFRVHGRLARGQHSDVFLARRERALTEMVLLKVARPGGEDGLQREWDALARVRRCHEYIGHMTPRPIDLAATPSGQLAAVYRWRSGFLFTFIDARAEYPQGVDPRATVWMWNRILDQLACLHDHGLAHNAITAEHLLIHPRDHGVVLCGWSEAKDGDGRDDITSSGRCIAALLGKTAPNALQDLARNAGCVDNARQLKQELRRISEAAFGPSRFHTFILNGGQHGIR